MKTIVVKYHSPIYRTHSRTNEIELDEHMKLLCPLGAKLKYGLPLPSLNELNEIFLKGSGHDGLIQISWKPFCIVSEEYAQLQHAY